MLRAVTDKKVLSALIALRYNDDFKIVVAWLETELAKMRVQNDMETGRALFWTQGACQTIAGLLQTIESSGEVMRSIDRQDQKTEAPNAWA